MNFTDFTEASNVAYTFYSSGFKEKLNASSMYIPFKGMECYVLMAENFSFPLLPSKKNECFCF